MIFLDFGSTPEQLSHFKVAKVFMKSNIFRTPLVLRVSFKAATGVFLRIETI